MRSNAAALSSSRLLAAITCAVGISACSDAPTAAKPASAADARRPVYGAAPPAQYRAGNGRADFEELEVCKEWAQGVTPTDIKVLMQVRGGVTKDTVITITPTDGLNSQNQPIQCQVLWLNNRADPADNITVTEIVPATGYTTSWTIQTEIFPLRGTIAAGPSYAGTGTVAQTVPIGSNPNNPGALVTFTNTPIPPAALGDRVWYDANGNGVQDNGELGISGATVTLTGPSGPQSTTTNGSGIYGFANLTPGTYTVCVATPAGYTAPTAALQGGNSATDSDGAGSPNCATVTLASGANNTTIDFGFTLAKASLGDFVWHDLNANGIQESGEPGIGGATVTLTGPSGPLSTTTNGSGNYSFSNLEPGSYTVCTAVPSGFASASASGQGSNTSLDSDGSGTSNCASVTLSAGQNNTTIDFGFYRVGSLGDRVWNDANNDGVQDSGEAGLNGWTVTVRNASNVVVYSAATSVDGNYTATGLVAGSYSVCVTPASGFTQTYDLDGIATANCAVATLTAGQNRTDVDFGYRLPPVVGTGSIGNYTWIDANGNGRQDVGEPVLNGVALSLSGAASATTTSSGSGSYLFSGLVAGTYSVSATAPAGFTFTATNAFGTNSGNDSNGSPSSVTLAASASDLTIDFGFVRIAGSGQGCTPGYWKQSQHFDSWKWYATTDMIDAVFGVTYRSTFKQNPSGPLTLLQAVELQGNNNGEQLFRHGTAVLLNSVYQSGVSSPFTAPAVIKLVRDAWLSGNATTIAAATAQVTAAANLGCPLN